MDIIDSVHSVHWLYVGVLFVAGLAIGSFLNVVVYRVPLGMNLLRPPSTCPSCGTRIAASDNIPVFGWLFLLGRCRTCSNPISIRYPLVELATGFLWGYAGWRLAELEYGFWPNVFMGLLTLAFLSAMVVTFLIDLDFQIILDEISLGGLVAALWSAPLLPAWHHALSLADFMRYDPATAHVFGDADPWLRSLGASFFGGVVGFAFSMAIYYLANMVFREQIEEARLEDPEIDSALGLGDVKLMAFFGAFLGWLSVVVIFLGGSLIGAVAGSVMKYVSGTPGEETGWAGICARWRSGNSVLPFGPFLVTAAILYFFFGGEIRAIVFGPVYPLS